LAPDDHLLLPFDQFIFAELKPHGEQQQLRLVFVTHEVSVRGDSLNRIETIMQRKQLSVLKTLPNHQRSLIADGQPVIFEIVITEIKDPAKRSQKSQE
jgi:tagatose-1,6-bisphosphate aldolase non-catalytic subunit AgaZ/GatZ